jgi:hypothetical protein
MIVIDCGSKIKVVRSRTVSTSATTANTNAKTMMTIPAIANARGIWRALASTITAAAITAVTALIASERTGGGGVNTNCVC